MMLDFEESKEKSDVKESRSTKVRPSQYHTKNDQGFQSINDSQYHETNERDTIVKNS